MRQLLIRLYKRFLREQEEEPFKKSEPLGIFTCTETSPVCFPTVVHFRSPVGFKREKYNEEQEQQLEVHLASHPFRGVMKTMMMSV